MNGSNDCNKVLVCITPQSNSKRLIDHGRKISEKTLGELHILHVEKGNTIFTTEDSSALLQTLFDYGAEQGGVIHAICGLEITDSIVKFIKAEHITHVVAGATPAASLTHSENLYQRLKTLLPYLEVWIVERDEGEQIDSKLS